MTGFPISISQLARIFVCVFAGVLPQVRHIGKLWATRGQALHAFLANTLTLGWAAALELVEPEFYEACKCIDMARLPKPGEYAGEVAFAYNWRDDTARELGRGLERRYEGLVNEKNEIAGTADVVGLTDDAVVVLDYKTGWADLGPAANSWQLKGYAVAAARAYGRNRAVVGFIRIGQDGKPFFHMAELSALELDAAAGEIRDLLRLVHDLRRYEQEDWVADEHPALPESPRPAVYVEGDHCQRCASMPFCAAKMRLVAQLAGAPESVLPVGQVPVLSERELSTAQARLKLVKDLVERIEFSLKARASVTPFPVDGREGYWYGPVEHVEDDVQINEAGLLLSQRFGPDVARTAVETHISKASIERAIKSSGWLTEAPGRKITPTMRSLAEEARASGAYKRVTSYPVREHKELPGDVERAALPPPLLKVLPGGES